METAFDSQKYMELQTKYIRERIERFDNKLYLEFGGKLLDVYKRQPPTSRPVSRRGWQYRKPFAVMRLLTSFTKTHQKISSIFSAIFLPTASAISIHAAVWICSSGS